MGLRHVRAIVLLLTLVLSSAALILPKPTAAAPPPLPTLIAEVNGPGKGRVWAGAIPPNSWNKPVLVFVHGLHGNATDWWGSTVYYGSNDMYRLAYTSGYRTAFVSLNTEDGGPAGSMWENGETFNRQLDVIRRYYGVSSVNVIAHSKGGVDTNSAFVHYGASHKIDKLVTLSSPHRGSQLADLAHSWWAWWLAALIGFNDDGTYSMQTGYMNYFRWVTDDRPENRNVRIYTAGGTDHGPWFSAIWFGGLYLSQYGSNDGVVTVRSSYHPLHYARLFTDDIDHDGIRKGSMVWSRIEPVVRTGWSSGSAEINSMSMDTEKTTAALKNGRTNPRTQPHEQTSGMILRGGALEHDQALLNLPVEENVQEISFDLLAANPHMSVTVIDPSGARRAADRPVADTGTFDGAFHYSVRLTNPQSGNWSVELHGSPGTPYLLVAELDSPLQVKLVRDKALANPGDKFQLRASAQAQGRAADQLWLEALLTGTPGGQQQQASPRTHQRATASGKGRVTANMTAPRAIGLYQLGVTATGISPAGLPYERSFPTNLPVVNGNSKVNALPAGR